MKQRMGWKLVGRSSVLILGVLIMGASAGYAQGLITTVAGSPWTFPATAISPATNAPLGSIRGVAVDASGNVYACDLSNRRVMKITAAGSLTVVAGNGSFDFSGDGGPATSAALSLPFGVALDTATPPNVYIADTLNHVIRRVDGTTGTITTVAGTGTAGFSGDNSLATSAQLNFPSGLAVDASGNIYIADTLNHRIRKVSGATISTVDGDGTTAVLNQPSAVAVSGSKLYIADTLHHRIRKIDGATLETVAGSAAGTAGNSGDDGLATRALLNNPLGVWVAGADIYIADTFNGRIRKFTDGGTITSVAGSGSYSFSGDGDSPKAAALGSPSGVAVIGPIVYIADTDNKRVRRALGGTINTFAGNGNFKYGGDKGAATSASLNFPNGVAAQVGAFNDVTLYIADTNNHLIRKVSPGGTITTVAGTGQFGFTNDSVPVAANTAKLNGPSGVALDASGNSLYIADTFNHRIRKLDLRYASPTITTVAGNGTAGFVDNLTATSGELNQPTGVALDVLGNLYIADRNNHRIRKVTAEIISTVAGNGTQTGSLDGPGENTADDVVENVAATSASLNRPTGIAVSGSNIYVADTLNHRIRKFTVGGNITTVAGSGTAGFLEGSATTAQLNNPTGVAVDAAGNVYIADQDNHRIRKLTGTTISTVAGNGIFDASGDGGPATSASLGTPMGVALNVLGNLYIADSGNDRVRKLFAGLVAADSVQGRPGDQVSIPVILSLFGGATTDTLAFGLKVIPNTGPPPALSGTLSFSSSLATAPGVTAPGSGEISVAWPNLTTPLSGTVTVGQVTVTVPAGAADGQTYTIQITRAGASLAGAGVALDPAVNATLTVALGSQLVGDVSPLLVSLNLDSDQDDAGEFGDGVLTIQDLIEALRASLNLVPPPPTCSDRFDAMDSDPAAGDLDVDPATRGGNGVINTLDLIVTLRRVTNLDTSRPRRRSRAITPCP